MDKTYSIFSFFTPFSPSAHSTPDHVSRRGRTPSDPLKIGILRAFRGTSTGTKNKYMV